MREAFEYVAQHVGGDAVAIVRGAMAASQGPDPDGTWLLEIPGRYTRDGNPLPFVVTLGVVEG